MSTMAECVRVEAPRQCTHCNARTHAYAPDRTRKGWWRVTCAGCGRYYGYWQGADPRSNVPAKTNDQ